MEIKGLENLVFKLGDMAAKASTDQNPVVAVGFTAAYALYVHENMEIWPPGMRLKGLPRGGGKVKSGKRKGKPKRGYYWDPQGKAGPKFLEGPARELKEEFGRIILELRGKNKTMAQALMACGMRLKREAQLRVPVDTTNLKGSAFVTLESGEAEAAEPTSQGES